MTKPIVLETALGLSMIYGFAPQSSGQVRIYSEVGQDIMFCLYPPRHNVAAELEIDPVAETIVRSEETRTFLAIDDEAFGPHARRGCGGGSRLHRVGGARRAAGAEILRSGTHLDLLITDVGLPNGMNGRQVADAARELHPDLKVSFVTCYAENAVLSHGISIRACRS